MKKTLFTFAALMCMALGLTACGDDDEPENGVTASATYEIEFSQDLLNVAEVTVVYVDNKGQVNLDKPTSTRWTRKVSREVKNKVPVDFGFKLVYSMKSSIPEKETYELTATATIKGETPTSSRIFDKKMINEPSVAANKLESTLERNTNKAFGILVTKDGAITENALFTVYI